MSGSIGAWKSDVVKALGPISEELSVEILGALTVGAALATLRLFDPIDLRPGAFAAVLVTASLTIYLAAGWMRTKSSRIGALTIAATVLTGVTVTCGLIWWQDDERPSVQQVAEAWFETHRFDTSYASPRSTGSIHALADSVGIQFNGYLSESDQSVTDSLRADADRLCPLTDSSQPENRCWSLREQAVATVEGISGVARPVLGAGD